MPDPQDPAAVPAPELSPSAAAPGEAAPAASGGTSRIAGSSSGTSRIATAYLRAHQSSMARSVAYRTEFTTYGMVLLASTLLTVAILFRAWHRMEWVIGALAVHACILGYCSFKMYRFVRFSLARYAQRLHEKMPKDKG